MLRSREWAHVAADFRDHAGCRDSIDAGDGYQQVDFVLKRLIAFLNFLSEFRNSGVQELQLIQEFLQLQTVPLLKPAFECQAQLRDSVS